MTQQLRRCTKKMNKYEYQLNFYLEVHKFSSEKRDIIVLTLKFTLSK